ncbi:hypothetical protein V8C42DRAFT_336254 [Trichoderma barbatum]
MRYAQCTIRGQLVSAETDRQASVVYYSRLIFYGYRSGISRGNRCENPEYQIQSFDTRRSACRPKRQCFEFGPTLSKLTARGSCSARYFDLKSVLRFMLLTSKTNLGSNPLLTLLSLDWVSNEFNLGLEIGHFWKSELNSDTIATFLYDCANLPAGNAVCFTEVEDLVGRAIHHVSLLRKDQIHWRSKFQEIVTQSLDLGGISDWVSKCREVTLRMFTAGPDEHLLESCRLKEEERQDLLEEDEEPEHDDDYGYSYDEDDEDDDYGYC